MSQNWYAPLNAGEWARRSFSLLNIGLCIVSLLVFASEFRFDWCEKLLGRYLISINEFRPETGAVWETGRNTLSAHQSLSKIITKKEDTKREAQEAQTFSLLAAGLTPGEWVNLDRERFKSLYLSLSPGSARKILEPARLVWLLNASSMDRIFCEGRMGGMNIYFVDQENRVIQQIDLDDQMIQAVESRQIPIPSGLEKMEAFQGRIYPVDQFFGAVFKLPPDMIPDLMMDPELILAQEGIIRRVGIWNVAENGFISLGYEFEHMGEIRVLLVQAREWAVWQLSLILTGEHR